LADKWQLPLIETDSVTAITATGGRSFSPLAAAFTMEVCHTPSGWQSIIRLRQTTTEALLRQQSSSSPFWFLITDQRQFDLLQLIAPMHRSERLGGGAVIIVTCATTVVCVCVCVNFVTLSHSVTVNWILCLSLST